MLTVLSKLLALGKRLLVGRAVRLGFLCAEQLAGITERLVEAVAAGSLADLVRSLLLQAALVVVAINLEQVIEVLARGVRRLRLVLILVFEELVVDLLLIGESGGSTGAGRLAHVCLCVAVEFLELPEVALTCLYHSCADPLGVDRADPLGAFGESAPAIRGRVEFAEASREDAVELGDAAGRVRGLLAEQRELSDHGIDAAGSDGGGNAGSIDLRVEPQKFGDGKIGLLLKHAHALGLDSLVLGVDEALER